MITLSTNFDEIISGIEGKLLSIDANRICRIQAAYIAGAWRKRIHQEGKAADGSQIGDYSDSYMKVRTGNFGNNKVTQGKNKGQAKKGDAGVFTRGTNKGKPRPRYNRNTDTKVVLSLTRNMESYLQVIPLENGAAVGYFDEYNFNKSKWCEKTYGKDIFALTDDERAKVNEIAKEEISRIFS